MNYIFAVLLVAVGASAHQRCQPGTIYRNYCNICLCSEDGQTSACTTKYCDPSIFNHDGTVKIKENLKAKMTVAYKGCEPGQVFKRECNTCVCSDDGATEYCTYMDCGSGAQFNTYAKRRVCSPNSLFKMDCNVCTCSQDGFSAACTIMECPSNVDSNRIQMMSYDTKTDTQQFCKPGHRFANDCNSCLCNELGTSALCTLKSCEPKREYWTDEVKVCQPGQTFTHDCNTCVCNEAGTAAFCTLKNCDPRNKQWSPFFSMNGRCVAGKSFRKHCNQCICSADGQSAICTLLDCSTHNST